MGVRKRLHCCCYGVRRLVLHVNALKVDCFHCQCLVF